MAYKVIQAHKDLAPTYNIRGDNRLFGGTDYELIVSGPAETGKTLAGLLYCHIVACKYPGAKLTVIRKVRADIFGTALVTYQRDIIKETRPGNSPLNIRGYGGAKPEWYDYPNGSRIYWSGFDRAGASLSAERDVVFAVQAEQLSVSDWEYLLRATTGRGSVVRHTRLIGDCNPATRNHWILQRAAAGKLRLGKTTRQDNPALWDTDLQEWTAQGLQTQARLGSMTGTLKARLFDGLWANAAGAIYETFDGIRNDGSHGRHVCNAFTPPATWPRIVGVDPFGESIAAVWLALDSAQGRWHVYQEYAQPFGMTRQGHADNIMALCGNDTIFFFVGGGPSERQDRADYTGFGLPLLKPALTSVWAGIDAINAMFTSNGIMIHNSCPGLISEVGGYHRKLARDETPIENEIDNKKDYHLLDSLRYAASGPDLAQVQLPRQMTTAFQQVASLGY